MYRHVYMYTHTSIYIYIYIHTHVHTNACRFLHNYAEMHMYIHLHEARSYTQPLAEYMCGQSWKAMTILRPGRMLWPLGTALPLDVIWLQLPAHHSHTHIFIYIYVYMNTYRIVIEGRRQLQLQY